MEMLPGQIQSFSGQDMFLKILSLNLSGEPR